MFCFIRIVKSNYNMLLFLFFVGFFLVVDLENKMRRIIIYKIHFKVLELFFQQLSPIFVQDLSFVVLDNQKYSCAYRYSDVSHKIYNHICKESPKDRLSSCISNISLGPFATYYYHLLLYYFHQYYYYYYHYYHYYYYYYFQWVSFHRRRPLEDPLLLRFVMNSFPSRGLCDILNNIPPCLVN